MLKEREDLLQVISGNTLRFRIKQWIENFLANQPYIHGGRGVAGLMNMLEGLPAAIVGSGPTLDRNIKDIHLLKNKALIIACDSAVKALEAHGVEPDIIMVTDSKERIADFLRGIDVQKYTFVADTFIHPTTTELLQDAKRLYWYSTLPIDSCPFTGALNDWTGFVGNLGTGGCVATTAWWMAARLMQADPTILIGLPQGLYDPAQMYSSEVSKTVETEPYTSHLIETFDIFGKACYTYPALQSFAWWFQDAFLQIPGIFINCSEGGIMHENCLNMPLLAAIQKYLVVDFDPQEILFSKEHIIETMFDRGGEHTESVKQHRNLMEIIIDQPSLTNLSFRMGKNEKEFNQVVEIIDELRKAGFTIEETESENINPDGTAGPVARVFGLKGLNIPASENVPAVNMEIIKVNDRPMLQEMRELNLEPTQELVFAAMSKGLPPLSVSELAGMVGVELQAVANALTVMVERELVKEIPPPPELQTQEMLYIAAHLIEEQPIRMDQPATIPSPVAPPTHPDQYSEAATDPSITDQALNRIRDRWFPLGGTNEKDSGKPKVDDKGSIYVPVEAEAEVVTEEAIASDLDIISGEKARQSDLELVDGLEKGQGGDHGYAENDGASSS